MERSVIQVFFFNYATVILSPRNPLRSFRATKLEELERKLQTHDQAIAGILNAIRELMKPPEPPHKRPIGFVDPGNKSP